MIPGTVLESTEDDTAIAVDRKEYNIDCQVPGIIHSNINAFVKKTSCNKMYKIYIMVRSSLLITEKDLERWTFAVMKEYLLK